ncbi:MAG: DEAD/DEAH box helicase [Sphaerochaetaceae bacterium]|nr:DEAD/DEAH box helicase [Sphaerochaetaceae bacterium]
MDSQLYAWQRACMEKWFDHGGRGMVQVVTGAGKTRLAVSIAITLKKMLGGNLRVKIVVPKTFLVNQWISALEAQGVPRSSVGCWHGNHKDAPDRPFMVYVVNSARYTLSRHIIEDWEQQASVFLIADECHHYASVENKKIFECISYVPKETVQRYYSLGLSATLQTYGFSDVLVPALGPVLYTYGFSEAIEQEVITTCVLYRIALQFDETEREIYDGYSNKISTLIKKGIKNLWIEREITDFDFFRVLSALSTVKDKKIAAWAKQLLVLVHNRTNVLYSADIRLKCAQALIKRLSRETKIIVFGELIEQSDRLYHELSSEYRHRVVRYHSGMEDGAKARAIQRYREGEARILVCCKALDEGFDIPAADVGIVLSSTQTERQRIQRLGRILRRSEDKDVSALYYLYIENTVEESSFLPQSIDNVEELEATYVHSSDTFLIPFYDNISQKILSSVQLLHPKLKHIQLLESMLNVGQVRPDWLLDEELQLQKLQRAIHQAERNYWHCMVRMGKELRGMRKNDGSDSASDTSEENST